MLLKTAERFSAAERRCKLSASYSSFQNPLLEFGSFCIALLEIHIKRFVHKKFIVLLAVTVAAVGCLEAALVGKKLSW